MKHKHLIRKHFRDVCLKRDRYKCLVCSVQPDLDEGLDVHHITDRSEMPNGGYILENGISLCEDCHLKAEVFHISNGEDWVENMHPNDLYKLIGSSKEKALDKDGN